MQPNRNLSCTHFSTLLLTGVILLCCRILAQSTHTTGSGESSKPKSVTQFAYKGMYLGMTVREFSNNYRTRLWKEGWRFQSEASPSELNCGGLGSCTLTSSELYGLEAEPKFTRGGTLYFLSLSGFSSDRSADFVTAFTKKYGAPRQRTKKYQNGFGAVSYGREWNWMKGLSLLTIEENCQKLKTPCVTLMDYKLVKQVEKEESQPLTVE